MSTIDISPKGAKKAIQSLDNLVEKTATLINESQTGFLPAKGSMGYIEHEVSIRPDSTSTAFSQANTLIEAAGDHIFAFGRTLTEPMLSIAPWACARSALEACATSMWILDPRIDGRVRIQRSLAFRHNNLNEQIKIARLEQNLIIEENLNSRINDVEKVALSLGFNQVLDKNDKRIGIGMIMPGPTKLIKNVLNEELTYRILSGLAHGQSWALQLLSFQLMPVDENIIQKNALPSGVNIIERNLEPSHIIAICQILAKAFSKTVYYASIIFGWDTDELVKHVKEHLVEIGIENYELNISSD